MQHLKVVTLSLLNVYSWVAFLFYQAQCVIFLGEEMMWEMRWIFISANNAGLFYLNLKN